MICAREEARRSPSNSSRGRLVSSPPSAGARFDNRHSPPAAIRPDPVDLKTSGHPMTSSTIELLWPSSKSNRSNNVLDRLDRFMADTELVLNALPLLDRVGDKILLLAERLIEVIDENPDAAIAAVHLTHAHRPSIAHAVHMGILCCITGQRLRFDEHHLQLVLAAALSANASVHKLEDRLHTQASKPSPSQLSEIRQHPHASRAILRKTGVEDQLWLDIVAQHHERPDGGGYPSGMKKNDILSEALMVGLADRYSAYISRAGVSGQISASDGLCHVFEDPSYGKNDPLVSAFIKELTVYPPGSFVRVNDREAMVVRRGETPLSPEVAYIDGLTPTSVALSADERIAAGLPIRSVASDFRALWSS